MSLISSLLRLSLVLCLILSGTLSVASAAPTLAEAYGFDAASLCGSDDPLSENGGHAGHDCLTCCLHGVSLGDVGPASLPTLLRTATTAPGLCDPLPLRAERSNPGWQGRAPPFA
jgi:hypothetical protein